ncbi:MAG: YbaB/EbfC family nucleoid-associated protein [Bacilli bacterium]|nr:YbaB/EbfC family nucleoid-associated protein [Bacilli bacterium]
MNMQQILAQAQKAQREMKKALAEIDAKEFTVSKGGAVTVTMLGSYEVKKIDIDKDAFDPENKEMIEDMIALAVTELTVKIREEKEAVQENITGQRGGMGF